ncbi:MAG: hypothetical protein NVS4B8_02600 [Herpetosiphon sp.]
MTTYCSGGYQARRWPLTVDDSEAYFTEFTSTLASDHGVAQVLRFPSSREGTEASKTNVLLLQTVLSFGGAEEYA